MVGKETGADKKQSDAKDENLNPGTKVERLRLLENRDIMFAGAASGFIGRVIIQPLDVIKTRFQLQVEPIKEGDPTAKYTSMGQATRKIFREEGISAFWKGHNAAQMLSITFGIVQFWSFERLVKFGKKYNMYEDNTGSFNFISGALAGAFASFATFPFDIMRTRQIAQSHKVYQNMFAGYRHMIAHEGFLSIYKGLSPTLLSVMPNAGLQFMIYKFIDRQYKRFVGIHDENRYSVWGSIIAGSIAGLGSKLAIYPLDLTRKRMQIQGFQKYRSTFGVQFSCSNMINCTIKTFKNEGVSGLFKGCVPSMWKAVLTSGINFAVFEAVCETLIVWKEHRTPEGDTNKYSEKRLQKYGKYGMTHRKELEQLTLNATWERINANEVDLLLRRNEELRKASGTNVKSDIKD